STGGKKSTNFMIKSMTGFGQGNAQGDSFRVRVDIRTVNNRFLDIHTRLPHELASLEMPIKKQLQAALHRGRVDLTISVEQMKQATFEINRPLVSGYLSALSEMKREFGLEGDPSLELIAKLPGALQVSQDSSGLDEALVTGVIAAVSQALVTLTEMRVVEGQELAAELSSRLDHIEAELPAIESEAGRLPGIYKEKLQKRLQEALAGGLVDEMRLAQEAVMLADRSDISEEIARLKSHMLQMREVLRGEEEVGKRLDFILQEMNREANTILSKSGDLAISDAAIAIKTEVEKLREQGQNVE
ncbi:MAG TPA: YicC/YloC family endoribonuclease, partial [Blastocatellia bacterium]|nr:YicC/YloC family endoribonuclease [Blastocatellia bacterium]